MVRVVEKLRSLTALLRLEDADLESSKAMGGGGATKGRKVLDNSLISKGTG